MADALARCSTSIVDRWFGPVHVRPVIAGSSEVVAANGVSLRGTNLRHGLWLGFTRGETVTPRFDQRAQDRQGQAFVAGFGRLPAELDGRNTIKKRDEEKAGVIGFS